MSAIVAEPSAGRETVIGLRSWKALCDCIPAQGEGAGGLDAGASLGARAGASFGGLDFSFGSLDFSSVAGTCAGVCVGTGAGTDGFLGPWLGIDVCTGAGLKSGGGLVRLVVDDQE